jgi:hypothetical protein
MQHFTDARSRRFENGPSFSWRSETKSGGRFFCKGLFHAVFERWRGTLLRINGQGQRQAPDEVLRGDGIPIQSSSSLSLFVDTSRHMVTADPLSFAGLVK